MNLLVPILFLFSLLTGLNDARTSPPLLSPIYGPERQPISQFPSTMSPIPMGIHVLKGEAPNRLLLLAIILVSTAIIVIILSLVCAWICLRNVTENSNQKSVQISDATEGLALSSILGKFNSFRITGKKGSVAFIEYALLRSATNGFSESNILGEGGSGCIYKARFEDGFFAALKKLDRSRQDSEREFENEVDLMGRIRHPNIVSLLGYCVHEQTRILAYELMQNGSLDMQLHGPSRGSALSWHLRMKIALDAARGLEYLHEHCNPPIIHRDLKSSNILLDFNFNAKLSDFGLAITVGDQSKSNIKLSGTLGYVAPEYLSDGKLTEKSDVYAFGVILLELLMGRKPVEEMKPDQCLSIVTWAMPQLTNRSKLPNIIDPIIRNTMDLKHLFQVAAVAVLCVQPEPSYRPLITDVLHSLVPLVPTELGGALRVTEPAPNTSNKSNV